MQDELMFYRSYIGITSLEGEHQLRDSAKGPQGCH